MTPPVRAEAGLEFTRSLRRREPDEWLRLYPPDNKIIVNEENQPFVKQKEEHQSEMSRVRYFMAAEENSRIRERKAQEVESFCAGAEASDASFVPVSSGGSQFHHLVCPSAWISDQNLPRRGYGRVLSAAQLRDLLQTERFPDELQAVIIGCPRQIYINHPTGSLIQALINNAPPSHVDGFRLLFEAYITPTPSPSLKIKHSNPWGGRSFTLLANLPSFAIGFKDQLDARAFSNNKKRLRRRYSLSFLNPKNLKTEDCDEDHEFMRQAFLYKVNYSLMLTGKSDQYWTAVCLNEDSFEDYPRLESEEELELEGLEEEEGAEDSEDSQRTNDPDPITFTPQDNKQPRTYFLQAVATVHKRQAENYEEIKDLFEASLDYYFPGHAQDSLGDLSPSEAKKWAKDAIIHTEMVIDCLQRQRCETRNFFDHGQIKVGPDGCPKGGLFRSLTKDSLAMRCLREILEHRDELERMEREFLRIGAKFKAVREELERDTADAVSSNANAQRELAEQVHVMTIIALINTSCWGMLQLAAPLSTSPTKVIMGLGVATIVLSTLVLVYFNRRRWLWGFRRE